MFSNLPLRLGNSTTEFPKRRDVNDNKVRKLDKELTIVPFFQHVPSSMFKGSTWYVPRPCAIVFGWSQNVLRPKNLQAEQRAVAYVTLNHKYELIREPT